MIGSTQKCLNVKAFLTSKDVPCIFIFLFCQLVFVSNVIIFVLLMNDTHWLLHAFKLNGLELKNNYKKRRLLYRVGPLEPSSYS